MVKRGRGKKFPTGFVKVAIMLFLRDIGKPSIGIYSGPKLKKIDPVYPASSKSTSQIIDYLRKTFRISEPRGIRLHLGQLYSDNLLDKETKIGIETIWQWKRGFESFRKIINFIQSNHDLVKDIVEFNPIRDIQDSLSEEDRIRVQNFYQSMQSEFNITKYWYSTEYTKSFFNEQTIGYFVNKAYEKHLKYKKSECVSKTEFEKIVLHGLDRKLMIKLMYYSPSLILYIINIEDHYSYNFERKIPQTVSYILLMVLNDLLITRHRLYHGISSAQYGISEKKSPDSKSLEIELYLTCRLSNPIQETK